MKQLFGILIFISLSSCSSENNNVDNKELQAAQFDSYKEQFSKQNEAIRKRLKGKRLVFLDSAILAGSSPKIETSLIFLAKKTDCSSCTSKAIEVLNSLDTTNVNRITIKIGYSEVGGYANSFKYSFDDSKSIIQDKLGYFHTPALILYGQAGIISSYLIPTYEDSTGLSEYLKTVYEIL